MLGFEVVSSTRAFTNLATTFLTVNPFFDFLEFFSGGDRLKASNRKAFKM